MMIGALAPYETSLAGAGPLAMLAEDGDCITLDVERYLAAVDAADASVLDRCRGPVLDVGCGPGRMVAALAERGIAALGVDIAPVAVELTRSRGVAVLLRDLFARVPGEGRWPTALVIDGNIGIGGDVDRILARLDALLAADGRAVVETVPEPMTDRTLQVRFAHAGSATGPQFAWAVIGAGALAQRAARVGFGVLGTWAIAGRHFVELGHVQPDHAQRSQVQSDQVQPGQFQPDQFQPGQVRPDEVQPGEGQTGVIQPGHVASGQLGSAPVRSEREERDGEPIKPGPVQVGRRELSHFAGRHVGRRRVGLAHPPRRQPGS